MTGAGAIAGRLEAGDSLSRTGRVLLALGLTVAACLALGSSSAGADGWSPRQRIPGIHDDAETPYLVADRDHTVHAFHSQPARTDPKQLAIVYSRWTLRDGWTGPADIVLPPMRAQASILGALLDAQGRFHIVFFSGDDTDANLYYSRAWAREADKRRAWSEPALIGEAAVTPRTAALAQDERGTLTAVYSGKRDGVGLYGVHSTDGGTTWSAPVPYFLVDRDDLRPLALDDPRAWNPQVATDPSGRLHLTWVVVGRDGNGKAIYVANWEAAAQAWSAPVRLATVKPEQYEVDWPSIVAHQGEVLVIFNDHAPTKRMMRVSRDDGRSWAEPVEVMAPTLGEYGNAAFAVDASGTLHAVFGDRARHLNLWHSVWRDGAWLHPEPVAPATEAATYRSGTEEFHPSRPRLVVSQGNVLLAVWRTDPGHPHNGTWFAHKRLDVPELPAAPLPAVPQHLSSRLILLGVIAGVVLAVIAAARKYGRAP